MILGKYKQVVNMCKNFEQAHFLLGKYYDKIALQPIASEKKSLVKRG